MKERGMREMRGNVSSAIERIITKLENNFKFL